MTNPQASASHGGRTTILLGQSIMLKWQEAHFFWLEVSYLFMKAHFGVRIAGAELNTVNVRLNASTIAFLFGHSSTVVVMVDQEYFALAEEALKNWAEKSKDISLHVLLHVVGDSYCNTLDHPR